jgi:hypothetical protein
MLLYFFFWTGFALFLGAMGIGIRGRTNVTGNKNGVWYRNRDFRRGKGVRGV